MMISREEVRAALTGPVPSLVIPFLCDGEIDFPGLQNLVDFCIGAGSKAVILTYGDSHYAVLSDQEVAEVTLTVARHVAGRALVVAADRSWATPYTLRFADFVRATGADLLMVRPPESGGPQRMVPCYVEHYAAIAQRMPIMLVTNVLHPMAQGLEVLEILHDTVDGVLAIKDDVCGDFARKMGLLVHDRWAIISGGQKQNHLDVLPYGCDGYLSTFITFKPAIAWDYWSAVQRRDWTHARDVIRDYDMPLFDAWLASPGGFNAAWHGALELFGIAGRWLRKPYYTLNDGEMERLSDFLKGKSLL
jgi:4-hydroxy-tetrahydrodipicolinate synthase